MRRVLPISDINELGEDIRGFKLRLLSEVKAKAGDPTSLADTCQYAQHCKNVLLHRDVVVPTEGKLFRVFFACLMVTGKLSM